MKNRTIQKIWILFATLLAGCGYQQSGVYNQNATPGYQWHSLYREDIQTIAVPIFVNRSFRRGVEMELSQAVIQDIEAHTPYKVVSEQRADTILEGEIVQAGTATISNDPNTALPQEQLFTITINFTWKNLRSGQVMVERRGFQQKSTYFPTLGEGQFVGSQAAVEQIAMGIVQEMQADW